MSIQKVLLFDFGGVIGSESYFGWLKKNIPNFQERRARFQEIANKGDLGQVTTEDFFKLVSRATNIPLRNVWKEIYEPVTINSKLISLIRRLKKDYTIVLFSNYMGEFLRIILEKHKIINLFDDIFISSEQRVKKPDKKAFLKILKRLNVEKDNVFFIDDQEKNVQAGQEMGIDSIVFIDVNQLTQNLQSRGILIASK